VQGGKGGSAEHPTRYNKNKENTKERVREKERGRGGRKKNSKQNAAVHWRSSRFCVDFPCLFAPYVVNRSSKVSKFFFFFGVCTRCFRFSFSHVSIKQGGVS
jgi:hypothetical protein